MSTPKHPRINKHPYHLVILDGCETYDQVWANAFGIDFSPNGSTTSRADYDAVGRPERGLVGWTKLVYCQLPQIFRAWPMLNMPPHSEHYQDCGWTDTRYIIAFGQFAGNALPNGFTGADSWQISGCIDLERQ